MRRKNVGLGLALLFLLSAACAHIALTPKQTVLWGINVYNSQYDLYMKQAEREDLTEDEKEVLRLKKYILEDLYSVIIVCEAAINAGTTPPEEVQDDLIYLINRLVEEE